MKGLTVHTEAADETREAAAYYNHQRKGLGREFRAAVEVAFQAIQGLPQAAPPLDERGTRKYRLRRFPYTIYYVELPDSIWIASVAHQKRRPGYWAHRDPAD